MVRPVHEVARYAKICVSCNVLIFWNTAVSGNPLVLEGLNKPAYIVFAVCEKCLKPSFSIIENLRTKALSHFNECVIC